MPPAVRPARPADVADLVRIYSHAVHHNVATFDLIDPPADYWHARLASTDPGDHVLVVADDDEVCGYAYSQPNPASVALHERLGFELVGTLREVGWKFGAWVDTRWYQLVL